MARPRTLLGKISAQKSQPMGPKAIAKAAMKAMMVMSRGVPPVAGLDGHGSRSLQGREVVALEVQVIIDRVARGCSDEVALDAPAHELAQAASPRVDLHLHQAVVENKTLHRGTGCRVRRARRQRVAPARQRGHVRGQEDKVAVAKPLRGYRTALIIGEAVAVLGNSPGH